MPQRENRITDDELISHVEAKLAGVDKTGWGEGPWQNEPDAEDFKHFGFQCHIRRHSLAGSFLGYVAVPVGHPWRGMFMHDIQVDFHGGITLIGELKGIYGDEYLVGGDFDHSYDFSPAPRFHGIGQTKSNYKTIQYVRKQVLNLARWAAEAQ